MPEKPDPYALEGVKNRQKPSFPWFTVLLGLGLLAAVVVILSPLPEKMRRKVGLTPPKEKIAPPPAPKPEIVIQEKVVEKRVPPRYYTIKKGTDIAKTSSGFDFKSGIEERPGRLASDERKADGSYEAYYTIAVNRPEAAKRMDEIASVNSHLPKILPGLEAMVEKGRVSEFFDKFYTYKKARLQSRAHRLDRLLTKHNYYDCQTMMELEHPETLQKIFLFQADMDVVADGSDGDRLPTMPASITESTHYQPSTSYGWDKTGTVENPLIPGWRKRLAEARAKGNASAERTAIARIEDMKKRSFLIAEYDPFIVIPVWMYQDRINPFGPNMGDYAAVIYGDKIYPAIVGDGGPDFKVGEASLRMAKEINSKATPYHRPVSDVSVTYIVFPRSSGKWQTPNYEDWRTEVEKLIGKIGGLGEGYELHRWENTLPGQ